MDSFAPFAIRNSSIFQVASREYMPDRVAVQRHVLRAMHVVRVSLVLVVLSA